MSTLRDGSLYGGLWSSRSRGFHWPREAQSTGAGLYCRWPGKRFPMPLSNSPKALKAMQDDPYAAASGSSRGGPDQGHSRPCHFFEFHWGKLVEASKPSALQLSELASRPGQARLLVRRRPARGIPFDADGQSNVFCSGFEFKSICVLHPLTPTQGWEPTL